jgi:predicted GTPase
MEEHRQVTVLAVGDTGAGKSCFLNKFLGQELFATSDLPQPMTLETSVQRSQVGRWAG